MALLPQTLRDRLLPVGLDIQDQYFTIDQVTRELLISRAFFANVYGGSMQDTFPKPSAVKFAQHGMDDFMFMIPTDYQPEAPQIPGAPGLRLCASPGGDFDQIVRTFVKQVPLKVETAEKQHVPVCGDVQTAGSSASVFDSRRV